MSGLLALRIFERKEDFVGVIGCYDTAALSANEPLALALFQTLKNVVYASPYDLLPPNHDALNGQADEFMLRQIADTLVYPGISTSANFSSEAIRLNDRFIARGVWRMTDEFHDAVDIAARMWFEGFVAPGKWSASAHILPHQISIRTAYAVCRSNLDAEAKDFLVTDLLTRYFYEVANPPPLDLGPALWAELIDNPTSKASKAIITGMRSYRFLADDR